jgi:hypothetical protein
MRTYIPIVGKLAAPTNNRIRVLQNHIRTAERYHHSADYNICKQEREALAELLEKEANRDKLSVELAKPALL